MICAEYTVGDETAHTHSPHEQFTVGACTRGFAHWAKPLPAYSSKFSPRLYTQPQLFACLILMQFFKTDYRGISQYLRDLTDLRAVLGLDRVPNYSTLCYAQHRLLRLRQFHALQHRVWQQAQAEGWCSPPATGIVDATGLEARPVSRYYIWRAKARRLSRRHWPKLTLVGDTRTHLIAGAVVTWGPSQDSPQLRPAVR